MFEVLSVPSVGDGNPAAALALEQLAVFEGLPLRRVEIGASSVIASVVHRLISHSPRQSAEYTEKSEEVRQSLFALAYAGMSFAEFGLRAASNGLWSTGHEDWRWNLVQEHPLLGLVQARKRNPKLLKDRQMRLVVPDVFPKQSAIYAAKETGAKLSVWNKVAFDELKGQDVKNLELTRPYLLDGLCPDRDAFRQRGRTIVAKSSGSGVPGAWRKILLDSLRQGSHDWALHARGAMHTRGYETRHSSSTRRITGFFDDLGGNTKLVIGYPSELVGIVYDMKLRARARDHSGPMMITLPPRGRHEARNLQFAHEHGLHIGELALPGSVASLDVRRLECDEFRSILAGRLDDLEGRPFTEELTGTDTVWQSQLAA